MSVKPTSTFGNRFNVRDVIGASQNAEAPAKTAEFYLNVGYEQDDDKYPFVSLGGVALDTERKSRGRVNNREYAQFLAKSEQLREVFLGRAQELAPGEAVIVSRDETTGLSMELRRVGNDIELTAEEVGTVAAPITLLA